MPDAASRLLSAAVAAARLSIAENLLTQFTQASADACRATVALIRAVIRAQELRLQLAAYGGTVTTSLPAFTRADLVRAATDAVAAGFLTPDDPVLAGIDLG